MGIALLILSILLLGCADSKNGNSTGPLNVNPAPVTEDAAIVAVTEIERNTYNEVISAIWRTKFGQMVKTYLHSPTLSELNLRAEQVSNYIFKRDHKMITRLSALQLLKRDIIERGDFDNEMAQRFAILEGLIWQQQTDADSYPGEGLAYQSVATLLLLLPLGSPVLRDGLKNVARAVAVRVGRVSHKSRPIQIFSEAPKTTMRDLFSRKLFEEYQLTFPIKTFFQYFGPYSLVWFFWFDWKNSAQGRSLQPMLQGPQVDINEIYEEIRRL